MSEKGPGLAWAALSHLRRTGITGMRENQFLDLIKVAPRGPCSHPGCMSHVTHPCEGCGRTWGPKERDMPFKTTPEDIDHMFKYHAPKPDQVAKYEELRESALKFAQAILRLTPGCADQTAAIRKVREAVMTANAAIALEK